MAVEHQCELPSGLWTSVGEQLSCLEDVFYLGSTSKDLRAAIVGCVKALLAKGGELPSRAWVVFREAVKLVIRYNKNGSKVDLTRATQLLATLPARLTAITVEAGAMHRALPGQSEAFVQALLTAQFAHTLRQLQLDTPLTPSTATSLLAGLPSLTDIDLTAYMDAQTPVWRPEPPAGLTSFRLHCSTPPNGFWDCVLLPVDLSAIAAAQQLRDLHLLGGFMRVVDGISALAALSALTSLTLPAAEQEDDLGQLRAELWATLAQLPQLQALVLSEELMLEDFSQQPVWSETWSCSS